MPHETDAHGDALRILRDGAATAIDPPLDARQVARFDGEYDLIVIGFGLAHDRGERLVQLHHLQCQLVGDPFGPAMGPRRCAG